MDTTMTGNKMDSSGYQQQGFVQGPSVLPRDLIDRVQLAMDDVIDGNYETGIRPRDFRKPDHDHAKDLCKIDQPHVANQTIYEAITYPEFGKSIAESIGVNRLQVWAVQLLYKPGGTNVNASVGWHQDYQYWAKWWTPESNIFTAWLAISDVEAESGPMCFVPGSHRWGFLNAGDFFGSTKEDAKEKIPIPEAETWTEFSNTLPAGAFSVHHRLLYHGSHPNRTDTPRRSFAIHLCAEDSTPTPGNESDYDYVAMLDDPNVCPVIWQAT